MRTAITLADNKGSADTATTTKAVFSASLPLATTRKSMAKPRLDRLQCRFLILIYATLKEKFLCFSALMQAFLRSSSSMDRIWISSAPSILRIYCP